MIRPAVFPSTAVTLLTMLCLGLLLMPAFALKLEVLQQKLDESGAGWKAGETSLSRLSTEEFRRMLGLKTLNRDGLFPRPDGAPQGEVLYALPAALDWRNNNGNWVTAVKNQGQCGACYAFATLAALETLIRLDEGDPELEADLSEQYLISCGPWGTRDGYAYGGCIGNYSDYISDFLMHIGAPDESCFPYDAGQSTGMELSCALTCPDTASRLKKIVSWSYIAPLADYYLPQPEQIKAVLVNKPVPCGMYIYDDFKHYTGGIYEPVPGQESIGGHLACIVGYDDSQNCWIVKNSWGTDWGESGFFRIGYDQTAGNSLTAFGLEALDVSYAAPVSTTTTTAVTTTTSVQNSELPNLIPCAPYGWSSPIVPSSERGTSVYNDEQDLLYPTPRKTFVDFAVCNDSDVPLTQSFSVSLFIDGSEALTVSISEHLEGKAYRVWLDEQFTISEGQHTLLLAVDVENDISEEDEGDNAVEMSFSWGGVWPRLYGSMFENGSGATVQLLRKFRDEVVMTSGEGRACVSMLYRHSGEIAALLINRKELSLQTARVIGQLLPELSPLLRGEAAVLSSATLSAAEALLDAFALQGGPNVRVLVGSIREKMKEGKLFEQLGIRPE